MADNNPEDKTEKKRAYAREWYQRNREKIRAAQKEYNRRTAQKRSEYSKKYAKEHAEEIRAYKKKYAAEHVEEIRAYRKANAEKRRAQKRKYTLQHPEEIRAYNKKYHEEHAEERRTYHKNYAAQHVEALKKIHREYQKRRRIIDPAYRLAGNLRTRVNVAIRLQLRGGASGSRGGSAVRDLGCSIPEFMAYIESLFQPGMSWNNRQAWHLDHVIPLAAFDLTDSEQFKQACHFKNLQPLWKKANLAKGAKLPTKKSS